MDRYNNDERKTPNVRQQMQRPSKTIILIFCLIGVVFYFLSQERVVLEEWKANGGINNGTSKQQLQQAQQPQQLLTDVNDDNEEVAKNVTQVQGGFTDTLQHLFDANNLCSAFSGTSRASRLWKDHLEAILQALQVLPDDDLAKLQVLLQTTLTPARMRRAVQHLPTFHHEQLRRIVEILQKRFQADDDDDSHPPLRIAVFGGSVTIGRGCAAKRRMQHFACAWPNRFEHLVSLVFFSLLQILFIVHSLKSKSHHYYQNVPGQSIFWKTNRQGIQSWDRRNQHQHRNQQGQVLDVRRSATFENWTRRYHQFVFYQ